MTAEEYMILKKQGKTDDEIMRFWGISLYRLHKLKQTWQLPKEYRRVGIANPNLTKEQYIELKKRQLSDKEIAQRAGISKKVMQRLKKEWGLQYRYKVKRGRPSHDQLTEEQVRKYTRVHGTSLCFYCRNARPSRCAWIARYEPIWEKAEKRIIKVDNGRITVRDIEATVVRECEHYQPAKEVVGG